MPNYIRKAKKKNKNERIEKNVKPNLLKRNFNTDAPNKVWDTDVTYLIFKDSRAYLSTIIDLYNRLCPGMGKPYSNIVEYAEDILDMINILLEDSKQKQALFEEIL